MIEYKFCNGSELILIFNFWYVLECVEMILLVLFLVIFNICLILLIVKCLEKILCFVYGMLCFCNYVFVLW